MAGRAGTVWYGERLVGHLRETDARDLLFAYDPGWLDGEGFPVSISLPLGQGNEWVNGGAFFGGLLPEGAARIRICRRLGIDEADDTGLLLAIGADCAGALSIFPGNEPDRDRDTTIHTLDADALLDIARSEGRNAGRLTGETRRFSLAGAQDKLPVIADGGRYHLPDRTHPSTHILKFETFPRVCLSEYLANRVAASLGLDVVETQYERIGDEGIPYLHIRRYDRTGRPPRGVERLHQEDLLQATGEPGILKYQRDGGPSLARIAALVREHEANPATAIGRLRDWQVFNVLMGNWDGHAKNLAFLYRPGSAVPRLAPFYDLVSIEFLNQAGNENFSRELALAVGGAFVPERIGRDNWRGFAEALGIPSRPLFERIRELAERVPDAVREARSSYAERYGDDGVLDVFERVIDKRCSWVLKTV